MLCYLIQPHSLISGLFAYCLFLAVLMSSLSLGSVRQYRILQSGNVTPFGRELVLRPRFLQCILRSKPPCDLLTVRVVNPPVRDFHPLEK
jgi:hypothetical protein